MVKTRRQKYLTPVVKTKKINIRLFRTFELGDQSLLATCSCGQYGTVCIGDTCPVDCSCSCFLPGTLIKSPSGDIKIESLRVGDIIYSFNVEESKIVTNEVKKIFIHENIQKYLCINRAVRVTPEHRFWVQETKRWIPAGELNVGDKLFGYHGERVPIDSIVETSSNTTVYNLHVHGDQHNYFAENILVHNWK